MTTYSGEIHQVVVIGAGWTGRQIAAQTAAHGFPTWIIDTSELIVADALTWAKNHASELIENELWQPQQEIELNKNLASITTDYFDSFIKNEAIDLVIESVSETASVKRKVLKHYSAACDKKTIIASNSSYFLPSQLAKYIVHPERFAHLHFHVPVWDATLVDIVPGPQCESIVLQRLEHFAEQIGQVAIAQNIENPGYIFNYILQSVISSALELIDKQVATPEQIDMAWRTVTKMPLGPIGIIDRIGVDVVYQVLKNAQWSATDDKIERLMKILEPLIEQGRLGWKTGQGFYDYPKL